MTDAVQPAPKRGPYEGRGAFETLVIQGATMIDGTGAPPEGPVDIVIEKNKIKEVIRGGLDSLPENAEIVDANGMYVMPGFVDTHAHIGGAAQGTPAEYVYKLWLAHGVTTIREPGSGNGVDWTLSEKERSQNNDIVAPRIYAYIRPGSWHQPILTPEDARNFVRWADSKGADGLKLTDNDPLVIEALIDEANKRKIGTTAHIEQRIVAQTNALDLARMGLGSMEHWYGLPEALFENRRVQSFSSGYNYSNEYDRFSEAGDLWRQAAVPGSEHWNKVMNELLERRFTISPTFGIYDATRDVMRAEEATWHDQYTLPSLWEFFQPSVDAHGSFFFDWTTADEVKWKENYSLWMTFINEYKNRGGLVTAGSDSGFIYQIYGFGFIRELEMLQEAGFHPLEVIKSATINGAQLLSEENHQSLKYGVIRPEMFADLVLVEENPLHNFKTLYGTGTPQLDVDSGEVEQIGRVKYTIKDGIIYDPDQLLDDVKEMVEEDE